MTCINMPARVYLKAKTEKRNERRKQLKTICEDNVRTTPAMHRTTLLIIKLIWEAELPPSRPELVAAAEIGGERLRQLLVRLRKAGLIVSELEPEADARARGGRRLLRYRLTRKGQRQAKLALQQEATLIAGKWQFLPRRKRRRSNSAAGYWEQLALCHTTSRQ
jgi:DNA-binding PadR family transcriptional regulator